MYRIPGFKTLSAHAEEGTRQLTAAYRRATGVAEALAVEARIDAAFRGAATTQRQG
jgi:hypothetical protein